ncbi:hypothetical protein, partial [Paenibacillus sonchi]|uniref:hypothetical protein n=1 Tax=Paenibacillus sonchi TaxID=373687 RepID=UPI001ADFE359
LQREGRDLARVAAGRSLFLKLRLLSGICTTNLIANPLLRLLSGICTTNSAKTASIRSFQQK